jgi:spore coat polysaccharide biosynthesis predicted glycosyltransferase SpsG
VPWLGSLIAESDILVCGGGITLYEGAFLGKPMLAIANELHEIETIKYFVLKGASQYIGFRNKWDDKVLLNTVSDICVDENVRKRMHESGLKLVDGMGLQRVSKILDDLIDS